MIYINYVFKIIDFKQLFGNRLKTLPLHYHSRITFIRVLMMMMIVTFLRNKYAHCMEAFDGLNKCSRTNQNTGSFKPN